MSRHTSTEQFVLLALDGLQSRLDAFQEQLDALRQTLTAAAPKPAIASAIHPTIQTSPYAITIGPAAGKRKRGPGPITAAGRKALSDAMKARWAKKKARASHGWPDDPEERSAEMRRRMAKRKPRTKLA